jgi:hypothetical protein
MIDLDSGSALAQAVATERMQESAEVHGRARRARIDALTEPDELRQVLTRITQEILEQHFVDEVEPAGIDREEFVAALTVVASTLNVIGIFAFDLGAHAQEVYDRRIADFPIEPPS